MPAFDELRADYAMDWKRMVIRDNRRNSVDAIARNLIKDKERYRSVEKPTGIPWFVIAVLHQRESDADFTTHLHNGDPLRRRTYHVPAGRPPPPAQPPFTWEESAIDALTFDGLSKIKEWPIERVAYQCEGYNGWGYYHRGVPSPYLWSFSSIYRAGKYVADGEWSASAVDQQCGVLPMLRAMSMMDSSVRLNGAPKAIPSAAFAPPATPPPAPPSRPPSRAPTPQPIPTRPLWRVFFDLLTKWRT